ncbi:hypothetical protein [Fuerstiella marisgermanici]|uniref:IrrE N-terminal-like domain-containing protein n=1 Tax=Fuerstiella marisgermanici TaxID=1891926 RepID=A0A1P8W9L8_9PLAN|nr:hypothetical protein [Fuerstiella marisgermanici]APZ90739.1 hypothetical protein Fuma_00321 [Fuerstiella marisgermanici]
MRRFDLSDISTSVIDEITAMRIRQYEQLSGTSVKLPVPVENIVEQVLKLDFDWIDIDEREGEQILAGLVPEQKRIVLNSRHLNLFAEKPGLERSTIGHEAGHWDIDIDRTSLHHPRLPGFDIQDSVVRRQTADNSILVEVLNRAVYDDRYFELYRHLTAGQDTPEVKSAVDRYQSSLLMPSWLIRDAVQDIDVTNWSDLYELAERAQVTISNLVVRLHRMDIIFIPQGSKQIFAGKDRFVGQMLLF